MAIIDRAVVEVLSTLASLKYREDGQGMAEYGLILAGVALLAIVAVFLLGPKIGTLMNKVGSSLS